MPYDLFALAAAVCWAFGGLLSAEPSRHLGAFAFTRWRMLMVAAMLWATTLALSCFQTVSLAHFATMALSGLIGIFVGDTALFSAMNRLGPRRSGILFSTNALFSVLLGFAVFGERMAVQAVIGAGLTIAGVMIAIMFGQHKCQRRPKSDPLYGVNAEVKVTHLKRLGYCRASVRRAEPGATKHGGEST